MSDTVMRKWHDMSTAPLDGTPVVCGDVNRDDMGNEVICRFVGGQWVVGGGRYENPLNHGAPFRAVKWRPGPPVSPSPPPLQPAYGLPSPAHRG